MNPNSYSPPPGRQRKLIGQSGHPSTLSQARIRPGQQQTAGAAEPTAPSFPPRQKRVKPTFGAAAPGDGAGRAGGAASRPEASAVQAAGLSTPVPEPEKTPLQVSGPTKPAKVKLERVPNFVARGQGDELPPSYQPASHQPVSQQPYSSQPATAANHAPSAQTPPTGSASSNATSQIQDAPSSAGRFARPVSQPNGSFDTNRPDHPPAAGPRPPQRKTLSPKRVCLGIFGVLVALIVAYVGWGMYLVNYTSSHMHHISALSAFPEGSGETWLIAGSDERSDGSDGGIDGDDIGVRTDSLILVRKTNAESMIVSLPRDTAVEIPGHGINKINAAYSLGGPGLLVETIENLTGVKINHYLQVSMGAVTQIVDALGGINLCYDRKVHDVDSALDWPGGCQIADGKTALAFARMRKSDPLGDIGRASRQRQVVSQMVSDLKSPSLFLDPFKQKALVDAVASNLIVDNDTGAWSLLKVALAYRAAAAADLSGAPPISDMNYHVAGHGSMVKLNTAAAPAFWLGFKNGTLRPDQYQQ